MDKIVIYGDISTPAKLENFESRITKSLNDGYELDSGIEVLSDGLVRQKLKQVDFSIDMSDNSVVGIVGTPIDKVFMNATATHKVQFKYSVDRVKFPKGISLNPNTGEISGTSQITANGNVKVTASCMGVDGKNYSVTRIVQVLLSNPSKVEVAEDSENIIKDK